MSLHNHIPKLLVATGIIFSGTLNGDEIHHSKFIAQQAALGVLNAEGEEFVLRESWWNGTLQPGDSKLVQLQLFKKNIYQFWFAVVNPDAEIFLNVYDGDGKIMKGNTNRVESQQKNVVSLVVTPQASGIYYLRLALSSKTQSPQEWALIYAFK